jgi:hypothetical protein
MYYVHIVSVVPTSISAWANRRGREAMIVFTKLSSESAGAFLILALFLSSGQVFLRGFGEYFRYLKIQIFFVWQFIDLWQGFIMIKKFRNKEKD